MGLHRSDRDAHRGRCVAFTQIEPEPKHDDFALPLWQRLHRQDHVCAVVGIRFVRRPRTHRGVPSPPDKRRLAPPITNEIDQDPAYVGNARIGRLNPGAVVIESGEGLGSDVLGIRGTQKTSKLQRTLPMPLEQVTHLQFVHVVLPPIPPPLRRTRDEFG
jgi:hypothetical protein